MGDIMAGIKINKDAPLSEMELNLWIEFQESLAQLFCVPIALYDSSGDELAASELKSTVCDAVSSVQDLSHLCVDSNREVVLDAVKKGVVITAKCAMNQHKFAIPVKLSPYDTLVIVGGHTYFEGSAQEELAEGAKSAGLNDAAAKALGSSIKTLSEAAFQNMQGLIRGLAVPFIKCLYTISKFERGLANGIKKTSPKGIHALEQVFRSLVPVLDRDALYNAILMKSTELVDAGRGSLMLLDVKNGVLAMKAAKGIAKDIADTVTVKLGEGIAGRAAKSGEAIIVKDDGVTQLAGTSRSVYKTQSFISVPLKLDKRIIGVLNVSEKTSGSFTDDDLHILLSFANFAALALERGEYLTINEELKTLSTTDPLTGLYNRRYFLERLFEEAERVKRHRECFTAFMLDIDNFKAFNDTYGHKTGDLVLKGIAKLIRETVRSIDVVARYGGEEFVVLLPHTSKQDSYILAERIRREVEQTRPGVEGIDRPLTISIGVAEFPSDAETIDMLLHNADSAMYSAKKTGKNRIVQFDAKIMVAALKPR